MALPAFQEILRLFLTIIAFTIGIIAYIRLNFATWKTRLFFPMHLLLSITIYTLLTKIFQLRPIPGLLIASASSLPSFYFRYALKGRHETAITFLAPATLSLLILFLYPFGFDIYLAFHRLNLGTLSQWIRHGHIEFVGIQNFLDVFISDGSGARESFPTLFGRTLIWTLINLVCHLGIGVFLAILLHQKIRFRHIYRLILVLPWAIPQLIAVLAWRGEFHSTYGYINHTIQLLNNLTSFSWNGSLISPLTSLGITPQSWWTDPKSLFISICLVNIWLGIPFMMVTALSGLQSIPRSYYEAASIDGAGRWQKFFYITLPLLRPVMIPASILGMIWTFNNVNVVYLMTSQRGGSQGADILVSDLYKQAFSLNRYSFSAAYAVVIFSILLLLTLIWIRASHVLEESPEGRS